MKFLASIANWLLLTVLVFSASTQEKPAAGSYKPFVGTWTSQFQGKTFVTLKLVPAGESVSGTMTGASIHIDHDGNLTSAEPKGVMHEVFDSNLNGDVLSFRTKEEDHEPVGFEMKLDGPDSGELTLKIPHPQTGAPAIKPWKIKRESGKAQDTQ